MTDFCKLTDREKKRRDKMNNLKKTKNPYGVDHHNRRTFFFFYCVFCFFKKGNFSSIVSWIFLQWSLTMAIFWSIGSL